MSQASTTSSRRPPPERKLQLIREQQREGRLVAMTVTVRTTPRRWRRPTRLKMIAEMIASGRWCRFGGIVTPFIGIKLVDLFVHNLLGA